jgi:pyrophosphatase PpaX
MISYSTVLFDFDGTLTNSLDLWVQAFQSSFAEFGLSFTDEEIIGRCFYRPFADVTAEFKMPYEEFKTHFQEVLWQSFENPSLFPGVQEILEGAHRAGARIGLVTSSSRNVVERALESMRVASYFTAIVTANDIINHKPHPEPVLLALRLVGSQPAESIFIGDSTADILAGHAAGTDTALFYPPVHHKFYELDALTATRPHFVFGDYAELSTHLFGDAATKAGD